jgi:LysR family transcriptional regulator, glycine cleavage system transcriptional activator
MARRLPSLNALKAFESTARHQSFTKAAAELCVTQGAVSQQVKALEDELGVRLFVRERRGIVITEAGRGYLDVVRDAFDRIAMGTERLQERQQTRVLTITTSPDFAAKWLVHRLGRFSSDHPEIDLRLSASVHHVDFASEDFDLAIRHGNGHWPGLHTARLCSEELFPVCSPKLLTGRGALRKPADVKRHRLLYTNSTDGWARWLALAGVDEVDFGRGTLFNQSSYAIDAAVDGQGIALGRTALVSWELIAGRLVRPFRPALEAPFAYWIVCPKSTAMSAKVATFRDWLLRQADEDVRQLEALERSTRRR